jgi:hypothetical protein
VEISLLPKSKNYNSGAHSRMEPVFEIWRDAQRQYYRAKISIRPEKFSAYEEYE